MKRMALASVCVIGIAACDSPVAPTSTPSLPTARVIGSQTQTDLGVLGSDVSSAAFSINVDGSTTGTSTGPDGRIHAFLLNAQAATPTMIDLAQQPRSLAGITDAYGFGINSGRHVIGTAMIGGQARAFYWDNTTQTMTNLGTLPGGSTSVGIAINDRGNMAGYATTAAGLPHAFYYGRASGSMRDVGTLPGGTMSFAQAINCVGGASCTNIVVGFGDGVAGSHAFRWNATSGLMQDLGTLFGGTSSSALGINANGDIVGFSVLGGQLHATYWPASTLLPQDVTPVGFTNATAFGISDQGEIVGYAQDALGQYQGFMWSPESGAVVLGTLLGGPGSYAQAINKNGQAAGIFVTPGGAEHAGRWKVILK